LSYCGHRLQRNYPIINFVISRAGSKNQKIITELRYETSFVIVFCHKLIWIVKVEIVGFFWYFAKLYQFMWKYDYKKVTYRNSAINFRFLEPTLKITKVTIKQPLYSPCPQYDYIPCIPVYIYDVLGYTISSNIMLIMQFMCGVSP